MLWGVFLSSLSFWLWSCSPFIQAMWWLLFLNCCLLVRKDSTVKFIRHVFVLNLQLLKLLISHNDHRKYESFLTVLCYSTGKFFWHILYVCSWIFCKAYDDIFYLNVIVINLKCLVYLQKMYSIANVTKQHLLVGWALIFQTDFISFNYQSHIIFCIYI